MPMKYEPVKREREKPPMEGFIETHPCFGMANFSRVSSSGTDLFGSVVQGKRGYVTLTISRVERHHDFSRDRLFGLETLIEVGMTESQFAELITNWNTGEGVPVTLMTTREGEANWVPGLERQDESEGSRARANLESQLGERMEEFKGSFDVLNEILNKKGGINKGDRKKIRDIFWSVDCWFNSSAPYAVTTFAEATERLTQKAKTEVEAFVNRVIRKTGLDALSTMRLKGAEEVPKQIEASTDEKENE